MANFPIGKDQNQQGNSRRWLIGEESLGIPCNMGL